MKNGDLLKRAEGQFDVFITVDRNLYFQQNPSKFQIAVLILHARTNRLMDLRLLVPEILSALERIKPGEIVNLGLVH